MQRLKKIGVLTPKSAVEITHSRLGIGMEKLDRDEFDPEEVYDHIAALGVKWVRLQSGWMRTEKEKGSYDFTWLDSIVDNLRQRGLIPWLNVSYGNPLYTPLAASFFGGVGCPPIETAEERAGWDNYVQALATHFKGRVEWFEIWNEADLPYAWRTSENLGADGMSGKCDPDAYVAFFKRSVAALKRGNPQAKVMGLALGHSKDGMSVVYRLMRQGLGDLMDGATYHTYTTRAFKRKNEVYESFANMIHRFAPHVKIIQGESGAQSDCSTQGALSGMCWNEEKQAKYLLRQMISDLSCDVMFTSYFSAVDMIECHYSILGDDQEKRARGYYGVLEGVFTDSGKAVAPYRRKRSYTALQNLAAVFCEDAVPVSDIPYLMIPSSCRYYNNPDCTDPTYDQQFFRLSDGSHVLAYWNHTDVLTTQFTGSMSIELMIDSVPRLIDPMDGSIYELPEHMVERTEGTVRLHHVPLRDYPLLLHF